MKKILMLRISFLRDFPYWDFLGLLICYQEKVSGFKTVRISPVAIICSLTDFAPQNEWTRFGYITHYYGA